MPEGIFSPMHILIILVIVAIFFGAKRLPELGKGLGEGLKGFKEGIKGVTDPSPAPPVVQQSAPPPPPPPAPAATEQK